MKNFFIALFIILTTLFVGFSSSPAEELFRDGETAPTVRLGSMVLGVNDSGDFTSFLTDSSGRLIISPLTAMPVTVNNFPDTTFASILNFPVLGLSLFEDSYDTLYGMDTITATTVTVLGNSLGHFRFGFVVEDTVSDSVSFGFRFLDASDNPMTRIYPVFIDTASSAFATPTFIAFVNETANADQMYWGMGFNPSGGVMPYMPIGTDKIETFLITGVACDSIPVRVYSVWNRH